MQDYYKTKGRIFDIQKYSIHDGPGIRTIVFLKGCALRCRWCCNPESQEFKIQKMTFGGKEKTVGRDVTVEEVMETVLQDAPYYSRSGGGVTLSGGESMLQPDFGTAILRASHEAGINTAMETTCIAPWETVERFLPQLDYMLMDIKHMDCDKHREFTSQPNTRILENARRVARSGMVELTIRVPVIPGFNNTPEEIRAIAEFAASLNGVKRLHLLPYHRLGEGKYAGLGREYTLAGIPPMDNEYMEMLLEEAKKSGLSCQIGG